MLVTFLGTEVALQSLNITKEEAAALRWRFGAIAADWDAPEMDVYDEMMTDS